MDRGCAEMPASFPIPDVIPNDDGWGPSSSCIPPQLADVPFAPFGKGDKIGRASDWTQNAYQKFGGRLCELCEVISNACEHI